MTQQISILVKTVGVLALANQQLSDTNGNLWNLPNPANVPASGQATFTATADALNPNAPFPGSGQALTIVTPVMGWISAATAPKLTQVEFLTMFGEFNNLTNFPIATVNFWLNIAYKRLPACVWLDLRDLGVALYAAHNLALEFQNSRQAAASILPGQNVGPLNAKSVDKVSAGYDTAAGSIVDGGNYNLTNYGTRFLELVDIVGVVGDAIIGLPQTGPAGAVIFPWVA